MLSIAIVFFGFLLLVLQSTFALIVPFDLLVPNLALPVVLYMGLRDYPAWKGALLSFVLGYMMDVFAGSPMGLHTLVAVAIFLVSRVAALRLFLQGWVFEVVLTFVLSLIAGAMILTIRAIFDKDLSGLLIDLKIVTSRAVATALVAPLVFRVLTWLDRIVPQRRNEGRVVRR